MSATVSRDVIRKVNRLVALPEEVAKGGLAISITRLTILKSLCKELEVAARFVGFLARKSLARAEADKVTVDPAHREMMVAALDGVEKSVAGLTQGQQRDLRNLLGKMEAVQNEHRRIEWGQLRIIHSKNLLLLEYALRCILAAATDRGLWAYHAARLYAERYQATQGTGLTLQSVPLVQDIADFWAGEVGLSAHVAPSPVAEKPPSPIPPAIVPQKPTMAKTFTHRQGQFLAFIHLYRKLHRRSPAETDMRKFFQVTPPSVHGMVIKLEELGLIAREPGAARSIQLLVPPDKVPPLDDVAGRPW